MKVLASDFEFDGNRLINFTGLPNKKAVEVLSWRNAPEVRKWMYSDAVISEAEHFSFIESLKRDQTNFYWVLEDKGGNGLGVLYFNKVNPAAGSCEFGMYVNPFSPVRGAGIYIGKLAKKLAFETAGLSLLRLEVFSGNETALEIDRLLGFVEEFRKKDHVTRAGSYKDVVVMSIKKDR